jgi:hypothetical protein
MRSRSVSTTTRVCCARPRRSPPARARQSGSGPGWPREPAWQRLQRSDPERANALATPVKELTGWDGVSTTESVAMTLFSLWHREVHKNFYTPPGVVNLQPQNITAISGDGACPGGENNRCNAVSGKETFSEAKPSLPTSGGVPELGIVFAFLDRGTALRAPSSDWSAEPNSHQLGSKISLKWGPRYYVLRGSRSTPQAGPATTQKESSASRRIRKVLPGSGSA